MRRNLFQNTNTMKSLNQQLGITVEILLSSIQKLHLSMMMNTKKSLIFSNLQICSSSNCSILIGSWISSLNVVYEREIRKLPISSYLPFIGALKSDPVGDLGKLKVDISVITERLENSIKLAGEAYYSEIYSLLVEKLDIANWKESINRKLDIILDVRTVYENKVEALRDDLLSVLIIVLIFIEMVVGILAYFK